MKLNKNSFFFLVLGISFFILIFWANRGFKTSVARPAADSAGIESEVISTSTEDILNQGEPVLQSKAGEAVDSVEAALPKSNASEPVADNSAVVKLGGLSDIPVKTGTAKNDSGETVLAPVPFESGQTKIATSPAAINIEVMEKTNDAVLKKMLQYEKCCGSVFTQAMIFTAMPRNLNQADELADDLSLRIKEMARAGVSPIVAAEPLDLDGKPLSYKRLANGDYDAFLRVFFSKLKASGLADTQIGMWIPLPESNLDEWGEENIGPDVFGPAYNHYSAILREYFGGVKITLLLDNETYNPRADEKEMVSLLPWTAAVDKEYVDSFGLQGYPWVAPANEGDEKDFAAASFLKASRAIEAAKFLGVNNIWFSTGTISQMFSGSPDTVVNIDADQRALMLDGILGQAKIAAAAGYKVMVCIFAEDRRNTEEETNFSYWGANGDFSGADALVFKKFTSKALANGIPLAVYDSMPD